MSALSEEVCGKIMDLPGTKVPGAQEITKRIVS